MKRVCLCLAMLVTLAGCSATQQIKPSPASSEKNAAPPALLLTEHALAGKIWDVRAARFITREQLAKRISSSHYLLLGETHDNPRHHQGEAWAILQSAAEQASGVVSFEMISDQQGKVIAGKQYDSAESLIASLNHIKTGWDYEQQYRPVFAAALQVGFAMLPASFDRQEIMAIASKGESKLPSEIKTLLEENMFSAKQTAASRKEIEASHCGMINDQMTNAMMLVQRAKDAEMALSLRYKHDVEKRVLVAGSGHVRKDRGVPFYLRGHNHKLLAMTWIEVHEGANDPESYAERWGVESLPFDVVWFTPRVDRPDPCEQFRRHMKKKQNAK